MSTRDILQYLSDGGYLLLFALSVAYAARWRSRLGFDIALFFGVIAAVVVLALATGQGAQELPRFVVAVQGLLIMALPYILLRLLHDLDGVSPALMRGSEAGLVLSGVALFGFTAPYPDGVVLPLVGYFVAVQSFVFTRFVLAARAARGLTRHRLYWVGAGSLLIAAAILLAGVSAVVPSAEAAIAGTTAVLGLASGVSYYVGFATPGLLKRAWRATDLREFVELSSGAAGVEQLLSSRDLAAALERRVAAMVGASTAMVLVWDEHAHRLVTAGAPTAVRAENPSTAIAYRVFETQRERFTANAGREDPLNAEAYREAGARAMFAAPVTFGERRMGVLVAYGGRPSLFAEDDLELVRILAGQIASFLAFRELLGRVTEMQAQERANALREEFLAAAAHDLKTPLTVVLGEVQLMQREARREPGLADWRDRLDHVNEMSLRMRRLIDDLLDASRTEQEGFVREREPVDLGRLARETAARLSAPRHQISVEAPSVLVSGDGERLRQVITNLLENAVKYSPGGGAIEVRVEANGEHGQLTVTDQGIGVPPEDEAAVFERFRRGSNLGGVRAGGMGIGLYLCRRIVEEHGGRISLRSGPGGGTTVSVALPLEPLELAEPLEPLEPVEPLAPEVAPLTPPVMEGPIAHVGSSAGGG